MKDIIKACLALVLVAILAVGVFYEGDKKVTKKPTTEIAKNLSKTVKATETTKEARIDIHVPKAEKEQLEVIFKAEKKKAAEWSKKDEWYTVQSGDKKFVTSVKAIQKQKVNIDLKGPHKKNKAGQTIEHWVKVASVKIDGKEMLKVPQEVWHNKPYKMEYEMDKGKTYTIEVAWEPLEVK